MKFKYHDRVKLLNNEFYSHAIFTVTDYRAYSDTGDDDYVYSYTIELDGNCISYMQEEHLELAFPES